MAESTGNELPDAESETTRLPVQDLRPSGPPFHRVPDFSRSLAILFQQMIATVHASLHPMVVGISALGLLFQAIWWRVLSVVFWRPLPAIPAASADQGLDQWIFPTLSLETRWADLGMMGRSLVPGVYQHLAGPFLTLADQRGAAFFFYLLGALGTLAIWSLAATMVCRLIGLRSMGQAGRWRQACGFSCRRFVDAIGSILVPLLAILVLSLPLMLTGILLIWDLSSPVAALLTIVLGIACLPMAVVLLGLILSWPLMFPAIAIEGRDCFESISRGYSYVFQRPFHFLWLVLVSLAAGAVLGILFTLLGNLATSLLIWSLSWGANLAEPDRMLEFLQPATNATERSGVVTYFSSPVLMFWFGLIHWGIRAIHFSVFWGLATGVYVLMRHYLDQAPLDSIYREGQSKLDDLSSAEENETDAEANSES